MRNSLKLMRKTLRSIQNFLKNSFKNMKFIFSQTNEIIELMDPSLKQIKKNIEEINKLDEKTKKKKVKI